MHKINCYGLRILQQHRKCKERKPNEYWCDCSGCCCCARYDGLIEIIYTASHNRNKFLTHKLNMISEWPDENRMRKEILLCS